MEPTRAPAGAAVAARDAMLDLLAELSDAQYGRRDADGIPMSAIC